MKNRHLLTLAAGLGLAAAPAAPAQQDSGKADAISLAKDRAAVYLAAWEKGDAAALGALFALDAEYTTDAGETISGRGGISERLKAFLAATPGAALAIAVDSAKFLTPDVLVEKGYATVAADGATETTRYTATHVRNKGQWLIAELHESIPPAADPGVEAITALEWLIGKWKAGKGDDGPVAEATWTLDGRFISRTTRMPRDEGGPFVTVEVIGYDPLRGQLRSWVFDNEGGFGEGIWRQDEDKWLVSFRATLPDGGQSSGDHILTRLDDTHLALESVNRVLNGEALPNRDRIEITKVPGDPNPAPPAP